MFILSQYVNCHQRARLHIWQVVVSKLEMKPIKYLYWWECYLITHYVTKLQIDDIVYELTSYNRCKSRSSENGYVWRTSGAGDINNILFWAWNDKSRYFKANETSKTSKDCIKDFSIRYFRDFVMECLQLSIWVVPHLRIPAMFQKLN